MQQSALLFAMNFVAQNKERFLQNFYLKSKRSVAKATNEGPAAYVIPADNPRPVEAADAVNLLRLMGVEVHTAKGEFSVKDQKYGAGSYVVRMDQPYSRMADMLSTRSSTTSTTRAPTTTPAGRSARCATSRRCASPTAPCCKCR